MNGYEQFIAVVLATFLATFLLLGIILFILAIKLVRTVKRITEKAEHLADKAEAVGDFFHHAAGPLALGRILTVVADTFFSKARKSKRKD
jgi:hypothetical protein